MKKESRRGFNVYSPSQLSPKARAGRERVAKMPPLPLPPTVREMLAQGLFPIPSRKTMSPTHQLDLIERYPGLYRLVCDPPAMSVEPFARDAFACGDGWFGTIDRLSTKLVENPCLVVVQVKEKWGELRLYFDAVHGAPEPEPTFVARLAAECTAAREESKRTCEICGETGTLAMRLRGWASVRCEPCEWLDDIEEACLRLVDCAKGWTTPRSPRGTRLDAAKRHIRHMGEAASHQSPHRRAQLPDIDWTRLDQFRAMTGARGAPGMRAAEVWNFIRDEVPALTKALR